MSWEVRRLEPDQLSDLYKLRYKIFFEELGALLSEDEIRRGYMIDSLDQVGYNYGLYDGTTILGSIRVVDLAQILHSQDLQKKYSMAPIISKFGTETICFVGRLALAPSYRSGPALTRLALKAYEDARKRGLRVSVADCSPYLLPLYSKLGYRCYGEPLNDSVYGLKLPILLLLEDANHFAMIQSPFAKVAERYPADDSVGDWFRDIYPQFTFGNGIQPELNLLDLTAGPLASEKLQRYSLFVDLTGEEISRLLKDAVFLEVQPGDYLIRKGHKENHLYFIIDGMVDSFDQSGNTLIQFEKGDVLGGDGVLVNCPRTTDVVVKSIAKCLLINGGTLERLKTRWPQLFAKVIRNLGKSLALKLQIITEQAA